MHPKLGAIAVLAPALAAAAIAVACSTFDDGASGSAGDAGSDALGPPADAAGDGDAGAMPVLFLGTAADGTSANRPADWPPNAGTWNAKHVRFSSATRKIVFYAFRDDLGAGSLVPGGTSSGVTEVFVSGPGAGASRPSHTAELYIADADGTNARCIGCTDVVDGVSGVEIDAVAPSTTSTPSTVVRRTGAAVHANRNKDLADFTPDGRWIIAAVEMPKHAETHAHANGEIGLFDDLWAISVDGKTWVQLTDFASTWTFADTTFVFPYACSDARCAAGCQYAAQSAAVTVPFDAYACSAASAPPPSIGAMRPRVGNVAGPSGAPVVWGETVGVNSAYFEGLVQHLASARLVFVSEKPALVSYVRNLTPTQGRPLATDLWSNPDGGAAIGTLYEPWGFDPSDRALAIATDVFHSSADPNVKYPVSHTSALFVDVTLLTFGSSPGLEDFTRRDAAYAYSNPIANPPVNSYGHWEEPAVLTSDRVYFATSADLDPPWDLTGSGTATFGLDTWSLARDRATPARRLTTFNGPSSRARAYPTAIDDVGGRLFVSVVPNGENAPGAVYFVIP